MKKSLGQVKEWKAFRHTVAVQYRYLPLRRPRGNSPTVWESVRSKPTPFALIILGLWPDWWKKTLLITKLVLITAVKRYFNNPPLPCKAKDAETLLGNHNLAYTPDHFVVAAHLSKESSSWQQRAHTAQHAPRSMRHGFPHKDWHHSCACTMSVQWEIMSRTNTQLTANARLFSSSFNINTLITTFSFCSADKNENEMCHKRLKSKTLNFSRTTYDSVNEAKAA